MRILGLFILMFVLSLSSQVFAAEGTSPQDRYNTVVEQTKNTGAVGFDKRHKAYRDYVLKTRSDDQTDESSVADIAPAAGESELPQKAAETQKENAYNQ